MLILNVILGWFAKMLGGRQEARMLAGAIVMGTDWLLAMGPHGLGGRLVIGVMRATFQIVDREADAAQPLHDRFGMALLAVMRRRRQRDLGSAEAIGIGSTAFDQRQGQQRLDRRATIKRLVDI